MGVRLVIKDLPTEERERRIEKDDGDADDVVLVTHRGSNRSISYHDESVGGEDIDKSCRGLKGETREMCRQQAQQAGYAPCKVCVLKTAENRGGEGDLPRILDEEDSLDAVASRLNERTEGSDE